MTPRRLLTAGATLLLLGAMSFQLVLADEAQPAAAEPPKAEPQPLFMRIARDDSGKPSFLETALVSYAPAEAADAAIAPKDLRVDLIGVVHIGDKAYYEGLNERFAEYDALLYELVAPEGAEVPASGDRGASMHPIAALQYGMKSVLDLEFQLDCIDYQKDNFVHADMSPDEFAASMTKRGESFWKMYFRMLGAGIAQQQTAGESSPSGIQTGLALFAKDRTWRMKRIIAEQFEVSGGAMTAIEGAEGSTIIAERNKKAFSVLRRQIDGGKRRIGVFYGAGHLPDMEKRLLGEFSLERQREQWLPAWALQPPE